MPKLAKVITVASVCMSFIPVCVVPFTTRMFVPSQLDSEHAYIHVAVKYHPGISMVQGSGKLQSPNSGKHQLVNVHLSVLLRSGYSLKLI